MRTKMDLKLLRPSQLEIEPAAQREYNPKHAEKIADNYDPEKLGFLQVAERDGRFYVVDGQHRRGALLLLEKDDPVPCVIQPSGSIQEDAKRFRAGNVEVLRPNPIDSFRVSVVSGDPESVEIDSVLKTFDLNVNFGGGSNDISAVASLQWIYRQGGAQLLVRTLALSETTWGRDRAGRDGAILKALAYLLDKKGNELDVPSLAEKVQRDSQPGKLLGTARAYRAATGQALWRQVADVVVAIYNKGRTTRRIAL